MKAFYQWFFFKLAAFEPAEWEVAWFLYQTDATKVKSQKINILFRYAKAKNVKDAFILPFGIIVAVKSTFSN